MLTPALQRQHRHSPFEQGLSDLLQNKVSILAVLHKQGYTPWPHPGRGVRRRRFPYKTRKKAAETWPAPVGVSMARSQVRWREGTSAALIHGWSELPLCVID